jgi:hypothetical protein
VLLGVAVLLAVGGVLGVRHLRSPSQRDAASPQRQVPPDTSPGRPAGTSSRGQESPRPTAVTSAAHPPVATGPSIAASDAGAPSARAVPSVPAAGGARVAAADVVAVDAALRGAAAAARGSATSDAAVQPLATASDAATATATAAEPPAGHPTALAREELPPAPSSDTTLPVYPQPPAIQQAERDIAQRIAQCDGHYGRHARVEVTYDGATGSVTGVQIAGALFNRPPIGPCIEQAIRAVPVPPFRRSPWIHHFEFMVH